MAEIVEGRYKGYKVKEDFEGLHIIVDGRRTVLTNMVISSMLYDGEVEDPIRMAGRIVAPVNRSAGQIMRDEAFADLISYNRRGKLVTLIWRNDGAQSLIRVNPREYQLLIQGMHRYSDYDLEEMRQRELEEVRRREREAAERARGDKEWKDSVSSFLSEFKFESFDGSIRNKKGK